MSLGSKLIMRQGCGLYRNYCRLLRAIARAGGLYERSRVGGSQTESRDNAITREATIARLFAAGGPCDFNATGTRKAATRQHSGRAVGIEA